MDLNTKWGKKSCLEEDYVVDNEHQKDFIIDISTSITLFFIRISPMRTEIE